MEIGLVQTFANPSSIYSFYFLPSLDPLFPAFTSQFFVEFKERFSTIPSLFLFGEIGGGDDGIVELFLMIKILKIRFVSILIEVKKKTEENRSIRAKKNENEF